MSKDHKKKKEEAVEEPESKEATVEKIDKAQEYLDGWKRCQADFENYKKRQTESQKDLISYAAQNIIMQIIPVLDNFHMATGHIPDDQKDSGWVVGVIHIQKQLEQVLAENGVEEIPTNAGDTFDPVLHEAIENGECLHCKGDHEYRNKIQKVLLKGYKMGEKIIRPARVVVE